MTIRNVAGALAFARQYGPVGAAHSFEGEQGAIVDALVVLAAEVTRLQALITVPSTGHPVPEALAAEDGEHWWMQGHLPPHTAVLAVVVEQMLNVGAVSAMDVLVGGPSRSPRGDWPGWSYGDQLTHLADLLRRQVKHIWVKDDPDDDERWLPAVEGEEGAQACTEVAL